jgi:hypothetical protein
MTQAGEPIAAGQARTLDDPLDEALRVVALCDRQGLVVRLMGGLAFHARMPGWTARVGRARKDIDIATRSKDRKAVSELLSREGYVGDKQYNALYGHKQLYFVDPEHNRPMDVLVDRLEMCHRLELAPRLGADRPTLPLAELLLSKLQIVQINRKDITDSLALLAEFPLADHDRDAINVPRIVELTSGDWGWWRTVTGNLAKLEEFVRVDLRPAELDFGEPHRHDVLRQLSDLRTAIDAGRKSTKWKIRAGVGDKVKWYEEPEEVGHGRD